MPAKRDDLAMLWCRFTDALDRGKVITLGSQIHQDGHKASGSKELPHGCLAQRNTTRTGGPVFGEIVFDPQAIEHRRE